MNVSIQEIGNLKEIFVLVHCFTCPFQLGQEEAILAR